MTLAPDDPRHGTTNGYGNLRCRCQPCRDAWAAKHREAGYTARYRDRNVAAICGTPGCDRKPDRAYLTGYCHRCGIDLGLRPGPDPDRLPLGAEWL
jgi:hypothetical protein